MQAQRSTRHVVCQRAFQTRSCTVRRIRGRASSILRGPDARLRLGERSSIWQLSAAYYRETVPSATASANSNSAPLETDTPLTIGRESSETSAYLRERSAFRASASRIDRFWSWPARARSTRLHAGDRGAYFEARAPGYIRLHRGDGAYIRATGRIHRGEGALSFGGAWRLLAGDESLTCERREPLKGREFIGVPAPMTFRTMS